MQAVLGHQKGGHDPWRSMGRLRKLGTRPDKFLHERHIQHVVFCERFGKNYG